MRTLKDFLLCFYELILVATNLFSAFIVGNGNYLLSWLLFLPFGVVAFIYGNFILLLGYFVFDEIRVHLKSRS